MQVEYRNHILVDIGSVETISGDSLKEHPADRAWSVSPTRFGAGKIVPISWISRNKIRTGCIAT